MERPKRPRAAAPPAPGIPLVCAFRAPYGKGPSALWALVAGVTFILWPGVGQYRQGGQGRAEPAEFAAALPNRG